MTFESTVQHFFDKCAPFLSHKTALQDWATEVTGAPDRPVDKVELCTGMTHRDHIRNDWQDDVEIDHIHHFLQVHLAETTHHHHQQQQTVLIERIKACELAWPHSAIPLPEDRIAELPAVQDEPITLDIVCVLKHGSHGSDVVHNFKVEHTFDCHGKVSAHTFVTLLEAIGKLKDNEHPWVRFVDCDELAKSFAVDSMKVSRDFMQRPDAFEHLLGGFSASVQNEHLVDGPSASVDNDDDDDEDTIDGLSGLVDQDEDEDEI